MMQNYQSKGVKITYYGVCLAYIALAPILPDYFSVVGIDSRNFNAFLLILFFVVFKRKSVRLKRSSSIFITILLIWALEQMFIYSYSGNPLEGIYVICRFVIAPALIATEIKSVRRFKEALHVIIFTGGIVTAFGIIEAVTHFNIFTLLNNTGSILNYNNLRFGLLRIISSHNQTNTYCLYLMLLLSLTFYSIQITERGRKLTLYKVIYWMVWANVLLTLSRSIILITFALQLVLLYFSGMKLLLKRMVMVVIVLLIAILIINIASPELANKIQTIYYMFMGVFDSDYYALYYAAMGERQANATGHRVILYEWVRNSMGNNWVFGNGMNTHFNYEYKNTDGIYTWTSYKKSIEVQYLNLLYHGGIVTLVCEILLYVGTIFLAIKQKFQKKIWENNISFSLVCFFTFLAYYIAFFSINRSSEAKVFCIIVALLYSYQSISRYNKFQI